MRLFLVLPDISKAKFSSLQALADEGVRVSVLVSYSILRSKPGMLPKLIELRETGSIGEVMLDSGAYHLAKLGVEVDPVEYASFSHSWSDLWDYVVAPDVPSDSKATIERTIEFAKAYGGYFIPVIQGRSVDEYIESLEILSPYVGLGGPSIVGVGGLDGERRRAAFVAELVSIITRRSEYMMHLFGVGVRLLRSLARRQLLKRIYSVDTTAWLAEILFRRRTIYRAEGTVEANIKAITGYLSRVYNAINPDNSENYIDYTLLTGLNGGPVV